MFLFELLDIDWSDRDHPTVVRQVPWHAARLGDASMAAKALLEEGTRASANAFRIEDGGGNVGLRSWERTL